MSYVSVDSRMLRTDLQRSVKRALDVLISAMMLILLAPLIVALCLMIKLTTPGPLLFKQLRVGKDGRQFWCLKLRTMVVTSDASLQTYLATSEEARREWAACQKLKVDPRITRIGHFLRKSSLDELPQLFNVLAGDMSMVGPRPIVPAETHRYGEQLRFYLAVRPGLTGLWQVSGRNNTTYDERVRLDATYVQTWSLQRDLVVLLKTIPEVLSRNGSF